MIKKIYAMSDIHGHLDILKENLSLIDLSDSSNMVIFLGDYVDRNNYSDVRVLSFIKDLQMKYEGQVVVLKGNHEMYLVEDFENNVIDVCKDIIKWVNGLPYFYETEKQIFVHAGVDEEALEYFHIGCEDYYFCCKFPASVGIFYKDIIAGHISAYDIALENGSKISVGDIFYDGFSHYYIDGNTEVSLQIPMLVYDCVDLKYMKMSDGNLVSL